jgi:hypothetical protein
MWKHFFRQLLGLPVGGPYRHVRIRFVGHGECRITARKRSTTVVIQTRTENGRRISQIRSSSLQRWNDGSPIEDESKNELLAATIYWLRTQGNAGEVVS